MNPAPIIFRAFFIFVNLLMRFFLLSFRSMKKLERKNPSKKERKGEKITAPAKKRITKIVILRIENRNSETVETFASVPRK